MNREIKFRGKKPANGIWVHGSLVTFDSLNTAIYFQVKKGSISQMEWVYVNPDTVGQYTELKDKNGVEIYEGDIMNDPTSKNIGVVEWNRILVQFQLSWRNMPTAADIFFMVKNGSTVIGNIHDNPELLKKEER